MNRRNFIETTLAAGAMFTVLPSAGRIWRVQHTEPAFNEDALCSLLQKAWADTGRQSGCSIMFTPLPPREAARTGLARFIETHRAEFGT